MKDQVLDSPKATIEHLCHLLDSSINANLLSQYQEYLSNLHLRVMSSGSGLSEHPPQPQAKGTHLLALIDEVFKLKLC